MTDAETNYLAEKLYGYGRLHRPPRPADAIVALGNLDVRIAAEAAELWLGGLAPAARTAFDGFDRLMSAMAAAGCLKISQKEAAFVAFASASGAVLTMLSLPESMKDAAYCRNLREQAVRLITVEAVAPGMSPVPAAAATLAANLGSLDMFTDSEKGLLHDWLRRIG